MQLETLDESLKEQTISKIYKNLANIFSSFNANFLPPHRDENYAIELILRKTLLFGPLYNLSEYQLKKLGKYIDKNLANEFIRPFKSFVEAPVLFSLKSDGSLQLYMDYHGLNFITIKNRYLFLLIDEILDCLSGAQVFTKINVKNAYYCLQMQEDDK